MPELQTDWRKLEKLISRNATDKGWKVNTGSTPFKGSTTSSELRELLNLSGDYRYLLNKDSANVLESIFQLKRQQDYYVVGAHSFSAKMFERSVWWKNIGADSLIFMETLINKRNLSINQLNYSTPFTSLNDEDTFWALNQISKSGQKIFAYLLTENTHLPFRSKIPLRKSEEMFDFPNLSEEAKNQMRRTQELLIFFIRTIDKDQWPKVVIVGDHMPPFSKKSDREFYSKDRVPYIILSKQ